MDALKNFTEHRQRLFLTNDLNNWVPGGYSGFQVTGMIEGLFGGFEIIDSGIFWVRRFLIYVGIFLRIQNILHNVIKETEDVLGCLESS